MYAGATNEMLYAAYNVVASFRKKDGGQFSGNGTAFFVMSPSSKLFLVTNRHMLDPSYQPKEPSYVGAELIGILLNGFAADNGDVSKVPRTRVAGDLVYRREQIKFAADDDEDVAVLAVTQLRSVPGTATSIDFFVSWRELADDKWIAENLTTSDFVVFPGYPPWHDKSEGRPILRTGTVASDPRTNYSHETVPRGRRVAYEAFSFGGSSGSPIIATDKGVKVDAPLTAKFREGRIVGINAGHMSDKFGQHSGVSYFFRSSVILDLIL